MTLGADVHHRFISHGEEDVEMESPSTSTWGSVDDALETISALVASSNMQPSAGPDAPENILNSPIILPIDNSNQNLDPSILPTTVLDDLISGGEDVRMQSPSNVGSASHSKCSDSPNPGRGHTADHIEVIPPTLSSGAEHWLNSDAEEDSPIWSPSTIRSGSHVGSSNSLCHDWGHPGDVLEKMLANESEDLHRFHIGANFSAMSEVEDNSEITPPLTVKSATSKPSSSEIDTKRDFDYEPSNDSDSTNFVQSTSEEKALHRKYNSEEELFIGMWLVWKRRIELTSL